MTLHCAGRLGVLSWIYEQRHVIAFELGLADESPIAECGTGYLDDGLVILQQDGASQAKPSVVFEGNEIELFFEDKFISIQPVVSLIDHEFLFFDPNNTSQTFPRDIFHPPSIA